MAKEFAKTFYQSKAWKIRRAEVLRRDLFTCHDCDGRANEVHHIVELSPQNIHDERVALGMDNLMSLCRDCHGARTKKSGDLLEGFTFDADGQPIPPAASRK